MSSGLSWPSAWHQEQAVVKSRLLMRAPCPFRRCDVVLPSPWPIAPAISAHLLVCINRLTWNPPSVGVRKDHSWTVSMRYWILSCMICEFACFFNSQNPVTLTKCLGGNFLWHLYDAFARTSKAAMKLLWRLVCLRLQGPPSELRTLRMWWLEDRRDKTLLTRQPHLWPQQGTCSTFWSSLKLFSLAEYLGVAFLE